jgi:hypothetical protein
MTSLHTPRFTKMNNNSRSNTPFSAGDREMSPGPDCYDTRVNSCYLAEHRKISFTRAKRFLEVNKPSATPNAALYDTRPAVSLLLRRMARVRIPEAKRDISP